MKLFEIRYRLWPADSKQLITTALTRFVMADSEIKALVRLQGVYWGASEATAIHVQSIVTVADNIIL